MTRKHTDSSTCWRHLDCEKLGSGQIPPVRGNFEMLRHADLWFRRNCCILIKLRFTDRHCEALHNWRIRLVVYGARLESVLV